MKLQRFLFVLLTLLLLAAPVAAQGGDPGGDPKDELTKELWCPICNGIRLDVCEQKVCEQMRDMIDSELAAGKTTDQIKAQFIDLYGPVVLGEPPREGFFLTAWILPIVLVVGGLAAAIVLTRRWSQKPAAAVSGQSQTAAESAADPYRARVDRELSDS